MLIDLHCHTKNAKSSETKREVSAEKFLSVLKNYNVGIVAITNHNLFDMQQYIEFSNLDKNIQVWPGIELDIDGEKGEEKTHGHVILVANPKKVNDFEKNIKFILGNKKPDDFSMTVTELINLLKKLDECLVICHYMKARQLSIEDINYIKSSISDNQIVMLEPTNSRKAALLYYADNEQTWFGSDVKDWDHYPNEKEGFCLPECRFNISSYEAFTFLLKKNRGAVLDNGYLDPKKADLIPISLFEDLNFKYQVFNDVNIIFGGKATAKTSILEAVEKYYNGKSKNVVSYYTEQKEDDLRNLVNKVGPSEEIKKSFDSHDSKEDIEFFKNWRWQELPSLSTFYKSEETRLKSDINSRFKITEASFTNLLNDDSFKKAKQHFSTVVNIMDAFLTLNYQEYLNEYENKLLNELLAKIINGEQNKYYSIAIEYYSLYLAKKTIDIIKKILSIQTSTLGKPLNVGLVSFYSDYKALKHRLTSLKENMKYQVEEKPSQKLGEIPLKGNVYRKIRVGFPPQEQAANYKKIGGERKYLFSGKKGEYDEIKKLIESIKLEDSTNNISTNIVNLQNKLKELKIDSLKNFLNYSVVLFTDKTNDFKPSNGVTTILLVEAALQNEEANVIILDEPDSGMGSDFINNELVNKINQRAKEHKIIFIATHDANLVVRTHPYSCLYREEKEDEKYLTYYGSSFDENLINIDNPSVTKTWVEAVVDKCEGGEEALNERNRTYGKY